MEIQTPKSPSNFSDFLADSTRSEKHRMHSSFMTIANSVGDVSELDLTSFKNLPPESERGELSPNRNDVAQAIAKGSRLHSTGSRFLDMSRSMFRSTRKSETDKPTPTEVDDLSIKTYFDGAWYGEHAKVAAFIMAGYDVNMVANQKEQKTMLHLACYQGRLPVVEYLVSEKADVNLEDCNGQTALYMALWADHAKVADYLSLNTNARVTFESAAKAAEIGSLETVKRWFFNCPIQLSQPLQNGVPVPEDEHLSKTILTREKALVQSDNDGRTVLHLACLNQHENIASFLLEDENSKNVLFQKDNDQMTPVDLILRNALIRPMHEVVSMLRLDLGGSPKQKQLDSFVQMSRKDCDVIDARSTFFIRTSDFLKHGQIHPFTEIQSSLVTGDSIQDGKSVLYVSHTFDPDKDTMRLYDLISCFVQMEEYDFQFLWLDLCCLHTDDGGPLQEHVMNIPLAMQYCTDVLVLPKLVTDLKASPSLEYLDVRSYSRTPTGQTEVIMAGLLGLQIQFGFYTKRVARPTFCCSSKKTTALEPGQSTVASRDFHVFETDDRSEVFRQYAWFGCFQQSKKGDKGLYTACHHRLMPTKNNKEKPYTEPSMILRGLISALCAASHDVIHKLRCLTLQPSDLSLDLREWFLHINVETECLRTPFACFLNLAFTVSHCLLIVKEDFGTNQDDLNFSPWKGKKANGTDITIDLASSAADVIATDQLRTLMA